MTHINAYYGAVDEAEAELVVAQGKLEAAKAALKNKQVEEGLDTEEVVPEVKEAKPKKVAKKPAKKK